MPDISMCTATTCPVAGRCYRSSRSGTRPDDLQSWMLFEPEKGPDCPGFSPISDIDDQISRLEAGDRPEAVEMVAAAILDDWRIAPCDAVERRLVAARGVVSRSAKFVDGEIVTTSPIVSVDIARRWIRTKNSIYLLGNPHRKMPFVVHVATRINWLEAWRAARTGTGQHTVPVWVWAAVLESGCETVDWPRRRRAANAVGEELARAGRPSIAGAWWTLATDASDKDAAGYTHERLCVAAGSGQTPEASDVIDGWGMLADGKTDGGDLSDGIAAARSLGEHHQNQPKTPLLLRMVMEPDAIAAAKVFLGEARITAATAEAVNIGDLLSEHAPARRAAAREIIPWLNDDGSDDDMKMCLRLLALEPFDHLGRCYIGHEIEKCLRDAGRDPSTERVAWAWRVFASDLTSPIDHEDPVAAAWRLDAPAPPDVFRGTDAFKELSINVDAPTAVEKSGAVVLKVIGGTSETTSGKEVAREFKAIAGKRLRLETAIDLADVRITLRDEFPHLHMQIDVLLSDLTEGEPIRLRSTLLVGPAGGGKSRLARRLADCLEIGLHRYDAAGSSDNAFGGTARRWSTGEHCTPLEAIRRHMIANPIVLVDEIDKAAIGRQNGNLCNSLMPFMEVETSRKFPDPFIQAEVDLSNVSYVLTANDDTLLPAPLLDRLRIIRLPSPSIEHLPALARGIVSDIARERGGDARWWPNLEDGELAVAEELWPGGSVRRLRAVIERILAFREQRPRN